MKNKEKKLEEIYKSMKVELIERTVDSLVVSDEKKHVKYAPSYQRNYIWNDTKATNLIETNLMNGIIPPLTVIERGKDIVVIDGRQRYETLLRFYNNEFKLNRAGLQKLKDWEGKTYDELAPNLRTLFKEYKMKMICYKVQNYSKLTDEDIDYMERDLFRRYNFGMTPLKITDLARAQYCYDQLTKKLKKSLETDNEFREKCIEVFFNDAKRKQEEREQINLLLIIIRELITLAYIPIIGEKKLSLSTKIINKYYDNFIRGMIEKEQLEKVNEFRKIFEKIWLIREILREEKSSLQNDIKFFKSVYWMLAILYCVFPNEFYNFNVHKFCHYLENGGESFFGTYNRTSGIDTERRCRYMKEYIEKELKLDIYFYLQKVKENKKSIIYIKDTKVCKDKDWNSNYLSQKLTTRKDTMEIKEIIRLIKENRFVVRPYYQRGEVTDRKKASKIIESIILGVKLPPIYLYTEIQKNGLNSYVVLDGQQRLIDILKYMGEPVTDHDYEYINTYKDKYSLTGLSEEELEGRVYTEGASSESINRFKRALIEDYVFDVIKIDKRGNENIDFVDIFIRLNQNPCPIGLNTFEMWNSFDIVKLIERIKEVAKYKAFNQQRRTMKEEEIVTTLAYMEHQEINIENLKKFFKINLRTDNKNTKRENSIIKISVKNKNAITKFLWKMKPNSKEENEFLDSVNAVTDFVNKLKILSDDKEKILIKAMNPNKSYSLKGDKNCFYVMWIILKKLDEHIIQTYKEELLTDLENIFRLMQNMPKDKNEDDFINYMKSIINKYSK